MLVSRLALPCNILNISKTDYSNFALNEHGNVALQIAHYLKEILDNQKSLFTFLRIPSVLSITDICHCSVLDVLNALRELKRQEYGYVLSGLNSDILLQSPSRSHKSKPQRKEFISIAFRH